eukprot:CAMPEP_0206186968 /NCGR_PEP_ID=MMETSP0166-20121206/2717_1 /ASSEMBLY_ACC=CAM_ASM_000260 /TAXON_ID=95228 /ORGANISM="Vannella robusta, Strain DIVA3 518/3/11/1/6" /LENGTH=477 /DNA_ID=CAMNT_0053602451 /DNA_START=27 /DNA_END=1457 /DNA_ORIENTATION=-
MRIGALFGRKDSGKKTDNLSAFQRVSEENCVLHPGGSKSPRDVGLRSSTTKRRTSKSVCLASPPNAANIITMSPRTRREKRKKTPAASPQLEAKNKILFIPESDPLYQLQDAYNEHSKCVRDLATIPPLEKRLESLVAFASNERDPLVGQAFKNPNPYHNKDYAKINQETKRIDKLIDVEKRKLPPKDGFTLNVLIAGSSVGQNIFWQGIDGITDKTKVAARYQNQFLFVMADFIIDSLRAVKIMQVFDELSQSGQLRAHEFLECVSSRDESVIESHKKTILALWSEPIISDGVMQTVLFHPKRNAIHYLFDNIERIASSSYQIQYDPEYYYLNHFSPSGTFDLAIKLSNLTFKLCGVDKIRGTLRKWIDQFDDNDIVIFLADISSPDAFVKSSRELATIVSCVPTRLAYFLFFIGTSKLEKENATDLAEKLPNIGNTPPAKFAEDTFRGIITRFKPNFKEITVEHVKEKIDINALL